MDILPIIGAGASLSFNLVVVARFLYMSFSKNGKSKYVYKDMCNLTHEKQDLLYKERHDTLLSGQKEIKDELILLRQQP
jgi:hypothetical protein